MKTNKLLILALPLLLAISACSNSGSQSNQSSQDSSSQEPGPSRSEEPLPEVTPEEQEALANEAFANISEILANDDFIVQGRSDIGGHTTPFVVVADGYFSKAVFPLLDDGTAYGNAYSVGYLANINGVFRTFSSWSGNISSPVGYALKTADYEEARQFVNSQQERLVLDAEKWEYIPNKTGNANFKTTDEETLDAICSYYYGVTIPGKFSEAYANVAENGESVNITIVGALQGSEMFMQIKKLNLDRYKTPTRESDYGDYKAREVAYLINNWKDREISEESWETYNNYYNFNSYLPFPSDGDRYYFLDRYTENEQAFGNYSNYTHIGFINTGDISNTYRPQLLDSGWTLDEGETNKFSYGNAHATLRFVPSAQCDRPDLYPNGVWFIDFTYVY